MNLKDSKLFLKNWNLPESVLKQYEKNGLTSMFQWQAECLSMRGVLDGRNLVYAAPTSAGKTLVVEILLLKRVLETGKKALFILPFISVAREKLFHMKALFEETGIRVDGYMGGHAPTNGFGSVDIAVCTIEKANGLINRLIEEKNIDQIGFLVVDELHMVGDEGRGYILELLLTKIRFMGKENMNEEHQKTNIQIVGMSATLPNLDLLADWLDAALYVTDFRPVPLQRCLKVGSAIYDDSMAKMRDFSPAFNSKKDEDNVAALCYETLSEGNSVLLFCPTKNWCEKLADNIAHQFYDLNSAHQKDQKLPFVKLDFDEIKFIFEQLSRCPVGVDTILNRTIPLGVAYHHAGLTTEERDIVEAGFRTGAIRVLVATSTLSSGVNLPARRVIIRTPTFNRKTLDVRTYLQMTGRAGRKGVDDRGESILICRQNEQSRGKSLLVAQPQPVKSCLIQADDEELTSSMKRAILEIIVNGIASTYESVKAYTDCTLLSSQLSKQTPVKVTGPITRRRSSVSPACALKKDPGVSFDVIENCIQWLVEHEFVHIQEDGGTDSDTVKMKRHIIATQLGRAALLSSLPTSEALTVLADLNQAMKALALDTELHLIYLVTPIFCYNEWTGLDWYRYLNVFESLSTSYKNAANLIGVSEQFLVRMASGAPNSVPKRGKQAEKMQRIMGTHRRFYAALALHDLVQEVPLPEVCSKYSCNRGMLQQLQQSAASFAGMVTTFCQELGWWSLEVLLREFQTRLAFGVQRELMDLMQISLLNSQRARALYSAGLNSCQLVANSNLTHIELILRNSTHFQTTRKTVNEAEWEIEERKKQRSIYVTGKNGLTEHEAAVLIMEEAKKICGESHDNPSSQPIDIHVKEESNHKPLVSKKVEEHIAHQTILTKEVYDNNEIPERDSSSSGNETGEKESKADMEPADSGCASKESSLTETQMKLMLDEDSMEFSLSENEDTSKNQTEIPDEIAEREGEGGESAENMKNEAENPSIKPGHDEDDVDSSSSENSPITLRLDGDSMDEFEDFLTDDDCFTSDNLISVPTFSASVSEKEEPDCNNVGSSNELPQKVRKLKVICGSPNNMCSGEELSLKPVDLPSTSNTVQSSKPRSSLSESQLCEMLDESFSQELTKSQHSHTIKTKVTSPETKDGQGTEKSQRKDKMVKYDSPIPTMKTSRSQNSLNQSLTFSPATLKAMDVSFSPCMFDSDTPGGENSRKKDRIIIKDVSISLDRLSTPKLDVNRKYSVKLPNDFNVADGESPFLSAGQSSCSKNAFFQVKDANLLSEDLKQGNISTGSDNDSLNDLFNTSTTFQKGSNSFSHSIEDSCSDSLGELDCALNLSVVSSDFSDNAFSAVVNSPGKVKENNSKCQKVDFDAGKRKSSKKRDSSPIMNHKETVEDEVQNLIMSTPPKCSLPQDFEDQLIMSSQKTSPPHRSTKRRKKTESSSGKLKKLKGSQKAKTGATVKSPYRRNIGPCPMLKEVTNCISDDESVIMSSQPIFPTPPTSQELTVSQSGLTIIDVCSHVQLFDSFLKELETKTYFSFAVATRGLQKSIKGTIGWERTQNDAVVDSTNGLKSKGSHDVAGIAFCWGQQDAYYVSFEKLDTGQTDDDHLYVEKQEFACLQPPAVCPSLPTEKRISRIKAVVQSLCQNNCVAVSVCIKKHFKILYETTKILLNMNWQDPTIASWMLDPSANQKTLIGMVNHFIPGDIHLLTGLNKCSNYGSIACTSKNDSHAPARVRACAEAVCSYRLMKALKQQLQAVELWKTFCTVEMPHVLSLAVLELNGIGFDADRCSEQIVKLHEIMRQLEKQAHKLAKRHFSLSSPNEVAKVLYGDLGLPPDGVESAASDSKDLHRIAVSAGRRGMLRKGSKRGGKILKSWSTKKGVLEKLKHLHPLPEIILNWRQISNTLSKVVHPFSRICMPCPHSKMQRVHSECMVQTVTGRVSVTEPNIQNIPKPYEVKLTGNELKSDEDDSYQVSIRDLFIPAEGCLFLAADYSQLELRIFAHLSNDKKLLSILNCDKGDVFKMIAAQWKGISIDFVANEERQRAKQMCYGMLYGIGARALAEQLDVDEKSAEQFMESFMHSYPGVRSYIRKLVEQCKEKGYVETLLGRQRYLPSINDSNMSVRAQAERQAVNTTVQGSAADLVKKATVKIQKQLEKKWTTLYGSRNLRNKSTRCRGREQQGCYFVLHLHDELMYEVSEDILPQVARILRTCMEKVVELKVKLPVKLSVGKTWGGLRDYTTI